MQVNLIPRKGGLGKEGEEELRLLLYHFIWLLKGQTTRWILKHHISEEKGRKTKSNHLENIQGTKIGHTST